MELEILALNTREPGQIKELQKLFKKTDSSVEFKNEGEVSELIKKGANETDKHMFETFAILHELYVVGSDEAISKCSDAIGYGQDERVKGWRTYSIRKR